MRAAPPPKTRLCVLVIAEQFRADYLDRYAPYFGAAGFQRLLADGAYFPVCRHAASSFSSTAIATLLTGAWPDAHGVVADQWFDPDERRAVLASSTPPRTSTVLEEAASDPRHRAWASGIDRRFAPLTGAHFFAGLDPEPSAPKWLADVRAAADPARFRAARWQGLRAPVNAPPLRVLTADPAAPDEFRALYRGSPFALAAQFDLLRAMAQEVQPASGGTAFLTTILGAPAQLGYETGATSPLMRDLIVHTDHQLALTIDALNRSWGAGNWSLAFTAAHGVATAPPADRRKDLAISGESIAQRIDHALSAAFDTLPARNRWVERYLYPNLWLRRETLRRTSAPYADILRVAAATALAIPGVAAWFTSTGLCSRGGDWLDRFRRSFHAQHSGDLMLAYESGCVEETGLGRGISYGSLYNYDTDVPLILYGSPFRSGVYEAIAESVDLAPTLARVLRVAMPSACCGRVLAEALTAT